MSRHAGYITIGVETLRKLLDFDGATIWEAKIDDFNNLKILLEHPDLPEILDDQPIPDVHVSLMNTYAENGVIVKMERTAPPKKRSK